MKIEIPEFCLIALVGPSSSGKSTFAKTHFKETEVLSSDRFRGMVGDDENDQSVTKEAFELLYFAAEKRLSLGHRTVINATNLQAADRKEIIALAKRQDVHATAIVFDLPPETLYARNRARTDRTLSEKTLRAQTDHLKRSIRSLKKEGFRFIFVLSGEEEARNSEIAYTKLWNDKREEHGPFDLIGDVHGCCDELEELLAKLGYIENDEGIFNHPDGRKAVFVGDLTDRGPRNADVLKLVMDMTEHGFALCVPGNHDNKLERYLNGRKVQISHGLERTIEELEGKDAAFTDRVRRFLSGLISHYCLDDGNLVVSHAGIRQEYIGRASARIREYCLYGDTTGETDDLGLPVRLDWAKDYRGKAMIVYGHVPQKTVRSLNNTYCIDTGCVFGGELTCLRYPEKEIVSVKAHRQYYEPVRALAPESGERENVLNASDFTGKLHIETSLLPAVTIREEESAAAFELMSRFGADPRWLIYLPPTMSPCETSKEEGYLEYPTEAFRYFEKCGINEVVCEKKHMGSRSVIVLCHTQEAAIRRFGITKERGIIYTRTGRRFFEDPETEKALLARLEKALTESGFWTDFQTDWVCLDAELMPWSEKAKLLLKTQYGPVGASGRHYLTGAVDIIEKAQKRYAGAGYLTSGGDAGQEIDFGQLLSRYRKKQEAIGHYTDAYREYCWDVEKIDDFRIAPFHLLAAGEHVYSDKTNVWHMETLKKYCTGSNPVFMATDYITVKVADPAEVKRGTDWWLSLTESGGEGMVVKPMNFLSKDQRGLIQPAVKCRGREYLRIIYGPEYLFPEHLERLKKRSLSRKRGLALKEFALGMESLTRFVQKEPLHRIHECAFGVLALESEPVDPRL